MGRKVGVMVERTGGSSHTVSLCMCRGWRGGVACGQEGGDDGVKDRM